MTDREALYQSILAHPDADLPRLVFADYLEENGEEALAAFIRMQCEMARVPKWDPIWIHGCWVDRSWMFGYNRIAKIPAPPGCSSLVSYRRGFPWGLRVDHLPTFIRSAEAVLSQQPIAALRIDWREHLPLADLATALWLRRIRRLEFCLGGLDDLGIRPLLESEHALGLNEIHFGLGAVTATGLAALLRSPVAQRLQGLRLRANHYAMTAPEIVAAHEQGAAMPKLESLDLSENRMSGNDIARLVDKLQSPKLNRLDVALNLLGERGCHVFVALPKLKDIESLDLTRTEPTTAGVRALAASPNLGNLKVLKLGGNRLGPVAVKAIVAAPWYANLHVLDLGNANISDNGAATIANSQASANLRVLDLTRNAITDPGAKALLDSRHLTSLIHLDLNENVIAPALLDELRKRFGGRIGWERVVSQKKKR